MSASTHGESPEGKADIAERGANGQTLNRRLFMQLQVFGGCPEPKALVGALERSQIEAVLYADLAHDIRLACHGLDTHDNDFLIGLVGKELQPLSHLVQTMRKTVQTSEYMASLGPFFVGHALWQSPSR